MIYAQVICDSVSPAGHRLTTFQVRCPRFIWDEVLTHRQLSRNASSLRAVPTKKLLEEVRSDELRAAPERWGQDQGGMSAAVELSDKPVVLQPGDVPAEHGGPPWQKTPVTQVTQLWSPRKRATRLWRAAALAAADQAQALAAVGVHKQVVNRVLMPYVHVNAVITATEWDNFFGLRLDVAADPTMGALAVAMWNARKASRPNVLQPGEWHLPFVDEQVFSIAHNEDYDPLTPQKTSVARCARVSYHSHATGRRSTVAEDLALYDRLMGQQPLHASPAEHQAMPDDVLGYFDSDHPRWANPAQHAN
jgi:thymidylate synthase ThyX